MTNTFNVSSFTDKVSLLQSCIYSFINMVDSTQPIFSEHKNGLKFSKFETTVTMLLDARHEYRHDGPESDYNSYQVDQDYMRYVTFRATVRNYDDAGLYKYMMEIYVMDNIQITTIDNAPSLGYIFTAEYGDIDLSFHKWSEMFT